MQWLGTHGLRRAVRERMNRAQGIAMGSSVSFPSHGLRSRCSICLVQRLGALKH